VPPFSVDVVTFPIKKKSQLNQVNQLRGETEIKDSVLIGFSGGQNYNPMKHCGQH